MEGVEKENLRDEKSCDKMDRYGKITPNDLREAKFYKLL